MGAGDETMKTVWGALLLAVLFSVGCQKGPDDAAIANDVKSKMFGDADLKRADIDVTVKDGEVTLRGTVKRGEFQQRAVQLAESSTGVKKVYDELRLPGQAAPPPHEATAGSARPAPKPSEPAQTATVPAGTPLTVRTIDRIDSSVNQSGQTFAASLDAPIVVNGEDIIPRGADVTLLLAEAKQAGHIKGRSDLEIRAEKIAFQGKTYPVSTNVIEEVGKSRGKDTAVKTGIGAGLGAAIGAIAGGGKGAAIGAGAGAGAGVGYQLLTKGQKVTVAPESVLRFTLESPLTVSYKKNAPR